MPPTIIEATSPCTRRQTEPGGNSPSVRRGTGASQIVLGSDYPYPWQMAPVDHIFACDSLSDEQKLDVLGRTAAKLLNIAA